MKATFRRQLVVPLALVALTATGCATAHTGRIAGRVGSRAIDTTQVSSYMNDLIGEQPGAVTDADRLSWQRGILTRLITAQIFEALAAKDGVSATQADLDTTLAAVGGQVKVTQGLANGHIPQSLQPTLINTLALQTKLVDKWLPVPDADLQSAYQLNIASYQMVNVKFVTVDNQSHAEAIAAKVRLAPDTFDTVAKEIAGPATQAAETGPQPLAKFGVDLGKQLWAAGTGDVLAINAQGAWRVLLVLDHTQTPFEEVKPGLVEKAHQSTEGPALEEHIKALLATAPIEINPRFGTWDNATRAVVDAASDTVLRGPAQSPADVPGGLPDGGNGVTPDPAASDPANPSDQPSP